MKCAACSRPNPDDHKFCGFCGSLLLQDGPPAGYRQQEEALRAAAIEDLRDNLGVIEKQAGDRIKEDAIKWAKGLMGLYGIALGILLAALSIFGIKQFSDLDRSFANVQDRLTGIEKTVKEKTADLLDALERQIEDADRKLNSLRTSLGGLASGVEDSQKQLEDLKAVANNLNFDKTIEDFQETVASKMEEIEKLRKWLPHTEIITD